MIFKNILLAYQLENYNNPRFIKFIYTHLLFWFKGGRRQDIVWTKKAIIIFYLTISFSFICLFLLYAIISNLYISFFLWFLFIPIYFIMINLFLYPVDVHLKNKYIKRAKKKLITFKDLKVIGITGSYGKTSTKEVLSVILSEKYNVLTTFGNKNTPMGISEIILDKLDNTFDIFIVEMGAYKNGDIKELCDLVNPDIGILTGITLQHLERFGSLNNIINTKFELIDSISANGLAIIDISSENVVKGLKSKLELLSVKKIIKINTNKNIKYLDNFKGIEFNYDNNVITTSLLPPHIVNTITIGYELGKNLGLEPKEILNGISKVDHVEHRMQPIYNSNTNVWVIDDSYNGNFESVKSTVEFLNNINVEGRKIYLSPGLTELGNKANEVHETIGKILSPVVDLVILIKNSNTDSITLGLKTEGFPANNILTYSDTTSAHNDLGNLLKSGDVIIFQNDWTDNYF